MKSVFGCRLQHRLLGEVAVTALAVVFGLGSTAKLHAQQPDAPATSNQTKMPEIVVTAPKSKPKPKRVARPAPQGGTVNAAAATNGPTAAQQALDAKMSSFDQSRNNLLTTIGASTYGITRETIENLPQGDYTPIDKVILQLPGVSYDSAVSNPSFHVRNEYGNVQIRINGVVLPEGVSGLGPFLDSNFIGGLSLLTGALPAEYGLRTAGVLDITSRAFSAPGGDISIYGGSRQTISPSFDYGGSVGNSQYFVAGRGNFNDLGVENPTPGLNAIHDETQQGKFFGYASTLLDEFDPAELYLSCVLQRVSDPEQSRSDRAWRFSGRQLPILQTSTRTNTTLTSPISRRCKSTALTAMRSFHSLRVMPTFTSFPISSATSNSTMLRRM